ncbi:Uncharacterised protein [Mycobacterium tuberculosis]|nr:Uncharacterised protein [Mycobacterium tuberculosis]
MGAECRCTTSVIWLRRTNVRSIDITGVIPDPAVKNRINGGAGSGGLDVSEYDRQRQRPSTSSPIPMYWPGW